MLRDLLARLGLDELISIIFCLAARIAWHGDLTRDDVAQIRAAIGEADRQLDQAA
jgi:hypothetical protein